MLKNINNLKKVIKRAKKYKKMGWVDKLKGDIVKH